MNRPRTRARDHQETREPGHRAMTRQDPSSSCHAMDLAIAKTRGDLLFPRMDRRPSARQCGGRAAAVARSPRALDSPRRGRQEDGRIVTACRTSASHAIADLYSLTIRRPAPRAGARSEGRSMTADPGDPGEPRTLQDPLAESLRVVTSPTQRGLLVRLMGGMAIRAHAPDWPARTRRVEVDLDFATRGKDRGAFYELLASEGYTAGQAPQRAVRRQAGLLRRRAAQPPGRRPGRQPRDVPPLRVRRPARHVEPDPAARRAPPVEAPDRQDQPQGRARRARPPRRAPARPRTTARPTRATAWAPSTCRASCRSPRTTGAGGGP